jgi:hypothetical protein
MDFKLSDELFEQIIFGMENQEEKNVFDTKTLQLIPIALIEFDNDRYINLPEWTPLHGFRLMEKFSGTIRNQSYRNKLKKALASGKGVFRNFKNVLKESPEIEAFWFSFKFREMKSHVIQWYNQWADFWDYEKLGFEPEETDSLVISDFTIEKDGEKFKKEIDQLDYQIFQNFLSYLPEDFVSIFYKKYQKKVEEETTRKLYTAETPEGEFAGFISGIFFTMDNGKKGVEIKQLYIEKEYQGLGLSKVVLDSFLKDLFHNDVEFVSVSLLSDSPVLLRTFETRGFKQYSLNLELRKENWVDCS